MVDTFDVSRCPKCRGRAGIGKLTRLELKNVHLFTVAHYSSSGSKIDAKSCHIGLGQKKIEEKLPHLCEDIKAIVDAQIEYA